MKNIKNTITTLFTTPPYSIDSEEAEARVDIVEAHTYALSRSMKSSHPDYETITEAVVEAGHDILRAIHHSSIPMTAVDFIGYVRRACHSWNVLHHVDYCLGKVALRVDEQLRLLNP